MASASTDAIDKGAETDGEGGEGSSTHSKKKKKGGKYLVLQMDPDYVPSAEEARTVFGITLKQHRNDAKIAPADTFNSVIVPKGSGPVPESAQRDLAVATIALKYTQSNSVCYALNGQIIGLGAGQQCK